MCPEFFDLSKLPVEDDPEEEAYAQALLEQSRRTPGEYMPVEVALPPPE